MNADNTLTTRDIVGGVTAGISLLLGGPAIAFLAAAVIGLVLGIPFSPLFYAIWAFVSIIGILAVAGGIRASVDKRRSING